MPKDDLFYDPDIDKQNQDWMDKKRKKSSSGTGMLFIYLNLKLSNNFAD